MVCLETDFIIALMRKDESALKKLQELVSKGERLSTTPITASELFRGAYSSERVDENLKKVRGILSRLDLLEFNTIASDIYGQTSSDLERKGEPIGDFDALIASIALAHNERVVTRNIKHFSRVKGLEVEKF
jgi:predicted nucleic acid-binding protein